MPSDYLKNRQALRRMAINSSVGVDSDVLRVFSIEIETGNLAHKILALPVDSTFQRPLQDAQGNFFLQFGNMPLGVAPFGGGSGGTQGT